MTIGVANGDNGATLVAASIATAGKATAASGSGFLIGITWDNTRTFSTLVDNKGNNALFAQIGSEINDATQALKSRLYYIPNGAGGAGHIFTFTPSAGCSISIASCELTTTNGSGVTLDQSNEINDTASPYTANITTLSAVEMLMSFIASGGGNPATHAESSGFSLVSGAEVTDGSQFWPCDLASRSVSSIASYTPSWTVSGSSRANVHLASFIEAGGGGGPAATVVPSAGAQRNRRSSCRYM